MGKYNTEQFEHDLHSLGISLSGKQIEQFITYYEMLTEWNGFMNLTAITEFEDVMKKHFIDSLSIVKAYELDQEIPVIDVGTGAGFPGLALKIAFPQLQMTLLDSLNKRIQFLDAVIEKLNLFHVKTIHGRAEDFAKPDKLREQFTLCVSRAVANLSTLSEYCLPFVHVNGHFISYKSTEETESAQKAITVLGGKIVRQVDFHLPDSEIYRNLYIIQKIKQTPIKYPRKAGIPGREPIK